MLQFDLLQNQWIMLALLGGFSLVLVSVLGYLAMWRRREPEAEEAPPSFGRWLRLHLPWLLVVTYAGTVVFAIVYVLLRARTPPNW